MQNEIQNDAPRPPKEKAFANLTDLQHLKNAGIPYLVSLHGACALGAEYTIRSPRQTGNLKIGERCVLFVGR